MNQERLLKTVSYLKKKIGGEIPIGLILGTGLGGSAGGIKKARSIPYEQIPYFPHSTVESHQGQLVWGTLAGRVVIALQGRFHLYEGYAPQEIGFPIRVLAGLGVKVLIVSNAAGGLDPGYEPGDLMLIMDHMNFTGENPLVGPHLEYWGDRFPDLSAVYDRRLT
ncbi:MAG TPA: purine-nucleoside phosphorylase, partial [Thermodesulfobacteriota bacterium]|nr:purine-nucleoside phosphorylase [Thermodesulfobacteriota bacterium]